MNVYIDESGDLGFTFKSHGKGSSRHLTIAFLLVPKDLTPQPKRLVKKFYKKLGQSPGCELKGTDLSLDQKVYFAGRTKDLLIRHPEIKILAITVKKSNVKKHIRNDPNKLYNYMIGLALPDRIKHYPEVTLLPDERSIKVKSGNSLVEYLQIKLWFYLKSKTVVQYEPMESSKVLNIQFIDIICNIIWSSYERNLNTPYNILKPRIKSIRLFF